MRPQTQSPRFTVGPDTAAILGLGSVAVLLLAYFDLTTNLALGDEWMFRWSVERIANGHGLQLWPGVVPVSLIQTLGAVPLAVFHPAPRILRLAVLPFLVLAAVMSAAIAKRLGANGFWSAVAALVVVAAPMTLSVSAAFTSDAAYLGLMMCAAWLALRWIQDGCGAWWFVLLALLATIQRQQGVALAVAVTAVILFNRRPLHGGDRLALLATWLGTAGALVLPFATGIASHQMSTVLHNQGTQHLTLGAAVGSVVELGPMMGLLLIPLALGLGRRTGAERRPAGRWELIPLALAVTGLTAAAVFAAFFGTSIWPGNVWGINSLGPLYIGGAKPAIFPLWAFVLLEVLVVIVFVVLLGWRSRLWTPRMLGSSGTFLVLLALAHLPPMALASPLDRYYIPVAAALAPFVAAQVSRAEAEGRRAAAARVWAIASLAAGLGFFAVGEQDYLAWQAARAQVQAHAYAIAGAAGVDAGYEANGSALAIPRYEQTGEVVDVVHLAGLHPSLALRFAPHGDPRPGADYSSVAPGKIVIVCLGVQATCPVTAHR